MDAIFRDRDGTELRREVDDPPPPKVEIDGRYYRLSKGLSGSAGTIVLIYDEILDGD